MRDILFRGKREDTGKWIKGYLLGDEITGEYFIHASGCSVNESNRVGEDGVLHFVAFKVIPKTVGQWTGLNDKNGKPIFEGDIVEYNGSIHQVIYEARYGTAYFGIVINAQETWDFCHSTPAYRMTVIGNVYDNPELLEVAE